MRIKSKYNGLFFPEGSEGSGHLRFSSTRSNLKLVGEFYHFLKESYFEVYGTLANGAHVSLHQCISVGSTSFHSNKDRSVELEIFPHYIVIGHGYLAPSEAKIISLSYSFSGGSLICSYGKSFDIIYPKPNDLKSLVDAEHERLAEVLSSDESKPEPRETPIGEHPIVAFFDGNHEIAKASIPSATVTISNGVTYRSPSAKGAGFTNRIVHSVEFHEGVTLGGAMDVLRNLHKFYELLLGYRQKYKKIELVFDGADETANAPMKLHWSRCNAGIEKRKRDVHPVDIPALATLDRKMFETMLSNWMRSMPEMAPSRLRLLNGMFSKVYSYDRIIGAANVFDLLPSDRTPKEEEISEELKAKIAAAHADFRSLPQTSIRDSVLSILGRTGKPSLRSKIIYRAEIVNKAFGNQFRDIEMACRQAVLCRNHYVHGSDAGFNYEDDFQSFVFLTDTLEFVFAASDLIECGWDVANYCKHGGTASHPFHRYMLNYEVNMDALKKSLKTAKDKNLPSL